MKVTTPLLFFTLLLSTAAIAQPLHCSWEFQDSACQGVLLNDPQPAPTCSTSPGVTTTSPAVWQGSKWSAPACSYSPPPSCSTGYSMVEAPSWNGSAWSAPTCVPNTPPSCLSGQAWNGSTCATIQYTFWVPDSQKWYYGVDFAALRGGYQSGQSWDAYYNSINDTITITITFNGLPSGSCTGSCLPTVATLGGGAASNLSTTAKAVTKSGTSATASWTVAAHKYYAFVLSRGSASSVTISAVAAALTGKTISDMGLASNPNDSTVQDAQYAESVLHGASGAWNDPNEYYDQLPYDGSYVNCASGPSLSFYGNGAMGPWTSGGYSGGPALTAWAAGAGFGSPTAWYAGGQVASCNQYPPQPN